MSLELVLYTQTTCVYCDMMKAKLDEWGYEYTTVNIQEDEDAKAFIVLDEGHKTVPQLYYGKYNVNYMIQTADFSKEMLERVIHSAETAAIL